MRMNVKHLWAPWRSEYINVKPSHRKRCFLCEAVAPAPPRRRRGEESRPLRRGEALKQTDKKNLIVKRGRKCFVIMNKFPYNAGHLLISPNAHKPSLEDLTAGETQELFGLLVEMKKRLVKALKPEGFNIGINLGSVAGAGLLSHIHIHLVPRWGGDTNFMPVLSGTKVISQSLKKLWKALS